MRGVGPTLAALLAASTALAGAPAEAPLPPARGPVATVEAAPRAAMAERLGAILDSEAARRLLGAPSGAEAAGTDAGDAEVETVAEDAAASGNVAPAPGGTRPARARGAAAPDTPGTVLCRLDAAPRGADEAMVPEIDRALGRGALGVEAADWGPSLDRRTVPVALAAVFDDLVLPCRLVEATAALLTQWAGASEPAASALGRGLGSEPAVPGALDRLAGAPAWDGWRSGVARIAPDLAARLIERLGAAFLAERRLAPVLLLAPLSPEPVAADGLVAAGLALGEARRPDAIATLERLARRDDADGQMAAVLLAEMLEPGVDAPMTGGWLAHLEILGAIATEHAGRPFARRAALAEVALGAAVLGPAAALRTLSLAHQRGIVDAATLAEVAPAVWEIPFAGSEAAEPAIDPVVWAAAEPDSFAALPLDTDGLPSGQGAVATSTTAPADVRHGPGAPSDPDWRRAVSTEAEPGAAATAAAEPAGTSAAAPGASGPATSVPAIEAYLRELDAQIADLERRLNDG